MKKAMFILLSLLTMTVALKKSISAQELKPGADITITKAGVFSEGLAWIEFTCDEHTYKGCINTTGKLLFYYEGDSSYTEFDQGYSHLPGISFWKEVIISKEGEIILAVHKDDNGSFLARGGGYTVLRELCGGGFYEEYKYLYSFIGPDGKCEYQFESDRDTEIDVNYLGKGVFAFNTGRVVESPTDGQITLDDSISVWFSKHNSIVECKDIHLASHKFVTYRMGANRFLFEEEGYVVYEFGYVDDFYRSEYYAEAYGNATGDYSLYEEIWDEESKLRLCIGNAETGECKEVMLPYIGEDPFVVGVSNGCVLLVSEDSGYYIYNIADNQLQKYQGSFENYIDLSHDGTDYIKYDIENNVFPIKLEGVDGNKYAALISTDLKEISEPIRCDDNYNIAGDLFVVTGNNECFLYNFKGEYIKTISDSYNGYGEGLAVIGTHYYDMNGNDIALTIDTKDAKYIDLNSKPLVEITMPVPEADSDTILNTAEVVTANSESSGMNSVSSSSDQAVSITDSVTTYSGEIVPASEFDYPDNSMRKYSKAEFDSLFAGDARERYFKSQVFIDEIFVRYGYDFSEKMRAPARAVYNRYVNSAWYQSAIATCPSQDMDVLMYQYMSEVELSNILLVNEWQSEVYVEPYD